MKVIVLIELEIIPFNPSTATVEDWKKYHIFRKILHDESHPNLPTVQDKPYEESMKLEPQRITIRRFNVFEKKDLNTQIGEVYFSFYKDGTDPDAAMTNISVLKSYRQKGIGLQLLKKLVDLAQEYKKSRIVFQSDEDEGINVIEHFHAQKISAQEQFRLNLSKTNWAIVNKWAEQTKPLLKEVKIEWVTVQDSLPSEILNQYIRIFSAVIDEHPKFHIGSAQDNQIPIGALKHDIQLFNSKGGRWIIGLIREKNGDISGLTELKWSPLRPEVLLQFLTHVKLQYRGSGKGKLLKTSSMLYIKDNFPNIKYIQTGFVGEKTSSLYKMNETIGFKLFYHSASYEIQTTDLEKWTNKHLKKH